METMEQPPLNSYEAYNVKNEPKEANKEVKVDNETKSQEQLIREAQAFFKEKKDYLAFTYGKDEPKKIGYKLMLVPRINEIENLSNYGIIKKISDFTKQEEITYFGSPDTFLIPKQPRGFKAGGGGFNKFEDKKKALSIAKQSSLKLAVDLAILNNKIKPLEEPMKETLIIEMAQVFVDYVMKEND